MLKLLFSIALLFSLSAVAEEANVYKAAHKCLHVLSQEHTPADKAVFFNESGLAVAHNHFNGREGFTVYNSDSVFFVSVEELSKSATGADSDAKMTVRLGDLNAPLIKFYFKSGTENRGDQISFGKPNEFDRIVAGQVLPLESALGSTQNAIDRAFQGSEILVKSNPQKLKRILAACGQSELDFKFMTPRGETTFQAEIKRLQDKLRPGVFTKEYWFPPKDS